MAVKTYKIVDSSRAYYYQDITRTDGNNALGGSNEETETVFDLKTGIDDVRFGPAYYYYHYISNYHSSRIMSATTYAAVINYSEEKCIPEPKAANKYTCRLNFPIKTPGVGNAKICVLNGNISSNAETAYKSLRSLSSVASVSAASAISVELTEAQLEKALKYGVVIFPSSEAAISDISNYVDITEENTGETIRKYSEITGGTAEIIYTIENLAAAGSANNFVPSAASILIANRDNTITWTYSQEFESAQYYVGITATYLDTGDTVLICKKQIINAESGSTSSYTIPADTLRTGKIRLTISAMPIESANYYDDNDEIWLTGSTVEYTVRSTPEAGAVTCDGNPNPTVSWESSTQAAFQVRFGGFDSGVIAGGETSYTIPRIFSDGNYAVSIRTATASGEWSDWTEEMYVSIVNTPLSGTVSLSASQFEFNVRLSWESTVSADKYAVYRDGEMIAVTDDTVYVDRYSNGTAEYLIRAVSDGNYAESNAVEFTLTLNCDVISVDGGYSYKLLKYTPSPKNQVDLYTDDITYHYYSGREKPVAISSGRMERVMEFTYVFKTRSESLFLRKMMGKSALIKTTRGCVIYGVVNELQYTEAKRTTVSFNVREIFRDGEEMDYV